jgi:hypothetical protein
LHYLDADVEKILLDNDWVIDIPNTNSSIKSFKKLTSRIEVNGFEHFYVLQYNEVGELHAINKSLPCKYWKLLEDGYTNTKVIYRSTIDTNFGDNINDITTPIYKNGTKIN